MLQRTAAKGAEPRADILSQQFRFFHGGEMPTAWHLCPALYIEGTLGPFTRRPADVLGEQCKGCRYFGGPCPSFDSFFDPGQSARVCVIEVRQKRRTDRLRCPVNHDLC